MTSGFATSLNKSTQRIQAYSLNPLNVTLINTDSIDYFGKTKDATKRAPNLSGCRQYHQPNIEHHRPH